MLRPITRTGTKTSLKKTRLVTTNIKILTNVHFGREPNNRRKQNGLNCCDPEIILTFPKSLRTQRGYAGRSAMTMLDLHTLKRDRCAITIVAAPAPVPAGLANPASARRCGGRWPFDPVLAAGHHSKNF